MATENIYNPRLNAPAPARARSSTPNVIVLCGTLIALLMVALCALVLYQGRVDALDRARDTSRNLALLAERDIERNFELYELSLQAVVEGVERDDVMSLPPRLRNDVLFDRAATARDLGSILVLDENGKIIIDSGSLVPRPGDFVDRGYFTVQRDRPDAGLYISGPYASRLRGGAPSIALSRRLSRPDGSFAGVAMLAINLEYFRNLFAGLSLGPHGAVSLINHDGLMIMRQPFDPRVIGRDISQADTFKKFRAAEQGSFSETSSIDGRRRLYYFRNFPNLPLIIMVAEGEEDIYAAWRRRAIIIGSSMGVLAIGFIALSFVLAAQFRRRMRAESELQLLARTDGLTGLHNRRTLGEILDQEWRRARRTRSLFSLLFVDIDRFKAFNDAYGHQAGDDALAAVARCIGDNIRRPVDTAARYGGEEFVVVLPDTPADGAAKIAEKIRAAISDLSIEHAGSEFGRVTASIGLASWRPERDDDVSALIRAADEALYDAKARGRNRIMQASFV
ncbi:MULTISPECIES: sensor domain-containing diguanylate cyclase [unclassified Caballeronia]|uniref:sensor domain-containing diguanylate cyclase n=1 Tax=unclassified Caballeronia TaxID=2646786 RepID=UPI0020287C01